MSVHEIDEDRPPERPSRPRILLVDDHESGRKALSRLLEALGFDVTDAEDGASALRALREAPRFAFVLTDLRLPDIDGREIVVAARAISPTSRIALITAWDVDEDEKERFGIEWIFLKPLNVPEIVASLQRPPAIPPDPPTG